MEPKKTRSVAEIEKDLETAEIGSDRQMMLEQELEDAKKAPPVIPADASKEKKIEVAKEIIKGAEKKPETPAVKSEAPPAVPAIPKKSQMQKWSDALIALPSKFQELQVESKRATIELGFALQIIENNEGLRKCSPASIYDAVIYSARIGITLNPSMGLCYLVPRGGKCCLDVGYRGWAATLKSYGAITHIDAFVVYEDEQFSWRPDFNELTHVPVMAKTEEEHKKRVKKCAYARAILPDKTVVFEVIPGWELEKIKKVSPAANGKFSPYSDWDGEMTRKAPIKRLAKKLQVLQDDDRVKAMFENEKQNDESHGRKPVATMWDTDFTEAEVVK